MSNGYKPGMFAKATVRGVRNVLVARVTQHSTLHTWMTVSTHPEGRFWHKGSQVTDVRPLLVLDPEDREAARRLLVEFSSAWNGWDEARSDAMQTALRRVAEAASADPRIPEPTEPLAEVIASTRGRERRRFVRGIGRGDIRWVDGFMSWSWSELINPILVQGDSKP